MKMGRGPSVPAPRGGTGLALAERLDECVDRAFLGLAIVTDDTGRARAAVAIRSLGGGERRSVRGAGVQRPRERESEARPCGGSGSGVGERPAQAFDQRVTGAAEVGETRIARQALETRGRELEDTLVGAARLVPPAKILVQIGEVLQRRNIAGIQCECGPQLALRVRCATQAIGEDYRAIEVHFLRARHSALEGLLIGRERGLEAAQAPPCQSQVVPAVG